MLAVPLRMPTNSAASIAIWGLNQLAGPLEPCTQCERPWQGEKPSVNGVFVNFRKSILPLVSASLSLSLQSEYARVCDATTLHCDCDCVPLRLAPQPLGTGVVSE